MTITRAAEILNTADVDFKVDLEREAAVVEYYILKEYIDDIEKFKKDVADLLEDAVYDFTGYPEVEVKPEVRSEGDFYVVKVEWWFSPEVIPFLEFGNPPTVVEIKGELPLQDIDDAYNIMDVIEVLDTIRRWVWADYTFEVPISLGRTVSERALYEFYKYAHYIRNCGVKLVSPDGQAFVEIVDFSCFVDDTVFFDPDKRLNYIKTHNVRLGDLSEDNYEAFVQVVEALGVKIEN